MGTAFTAALFLCFLLPARAQNVFLFTSTNSISIMDGGPATPYPSILVTSNITGVIFAAKVTLDELSHSFPDDIDLILAGPNGISVLLMSDAGGGFDLTNHTLTFQDSAPFFLPNNGQITNGLYKPSNYDASESFYQPAPPAPYQSQLSAFNGSDANGVWSLYAVDDQGGDAGQIASGWTLILETVDPATVADLTLTQSDSVDPVIAGEFLTYSLRITNQGPNQATGAIVSNFLPATVNFISASPSQGTCNLVEGTVVCNLGTMIPNQGANVDITVFPTTPGTITNRAAATANEPDLSPVEGTELTTVTPAQVADLLLTGRGSVNSAGVGQLFSYHFTVANQGPLLATGVSFTNIVPTSFRVLSVSSSQGSCDPVNSNFVRCLLGEIPSGAFASVTVVVQALQIGFATNQASVRANENDLTPANLDLVTQVTPPADVRVVIVEPTDPFTVSNRMVYAIKVVNDGPGPTVGVVLTNLLPATADFVAATTVDGTCSLAGGMVICQLGDIPAGSNEVVQLVIRPRALGNMTLTASVSSSIFDPDLSNNTISESTTIITPLSKAIINNGLIQLGINPAGNLNVPGGTRSLGSGRFDGTTFVGLRYMPTGAESTAPGCLCEGWGIADPISGVSGGANEAVNQGSFGLSVDTFVATGSNAVSTVTIFGTNNTPTFRVTHFYHPSVTSNLYEVNVTVENISTNEVEVLYRRVMDWDVEPTAFSEFSTVNKGNATNLYFVSNDGFASADPLSGPSSITNNNPRTTNVSFVDEGPDDHGSLWDFNFGRLRPGQVVQFRTFYGAAGTEADANLALGKVGAEAYSFGQPDTVNGPTLGTPNTFIFAFAGIGGTALVGADVGMSVTDAPDPVTVGSNLTYTLTITNRGPENATGILVTDTLPSGAQFVSVNASQGGCGVDNGVISCDIGFLIKGASATITLVATALDEGNIQNLASVTSVEPDFNFLNNERTNTTLVLAAGTFSDPSSIVISDAVPATPYPSRVTLSGLTGVVDRITVRLDELIHTFPADLDILLVGPGGETVLLMSDAGGNDDLNSVTLLFDDFASTNLPATNQIVSGSYRPTNYDTDETFFTPAPAPPYGNLLSVFKGKDPNGVWSLYVVDDKGADSGALAAGWRLSLDLVVAGPALRINQAGTNVVLRWPVTATNFVLEATTNLIPAGWTPVTNGVSTVGSEKSVTTETGGSSQFFRLHKTVP